METLIKEKDIDKPIKSIGQTLSKIKKKQKADRITRGYVPSGAGFALKHIINNKLNAV